MALTKVTYGLLSADTSAIDLNIDANTLYVDSSANRVGIGTSSPSYKLEVNSGTTDWPARFISSDDKAGIIIADDDTANYLVSKNSFLSIGSNADLHTNNLNVKSSGEVGIGTTAPVQNLHIVNTNGANIILTSNTGGENNGIFMTEAASGSPYTNGAYVVYDGANNAFKIKTGT